MPADKIPDFIAKLGHTDDAAVLFAPLQPLAPYFAKTRFERVKDVLNGKVPTG